MSHLVCTINGGRTPIVTVKQVRKLACLRNALSLRSVSSLILPAASRGNIYGKYTRRFNYQGHVVQNT